MKILVAMGSVLVAGTMGLWAQTQEVAAVKAPVWTDSLNLSGDLRLRHEYVDQEGKTQRTRERYRARLGLTGAVNETVTAGVRAISGSDDPASANETFDSSFSSKGLQLDQAYLQWASCEAFSVIGGKMAQPWFSPSELIWSSDVSPEGFSAMAKVGDAVKATVNAGYFVLDEIVDSKDDLTMMNGQVALETGCDYARLQVGGGIFSYQNVKGAGPLYGGKFFGNSTDEVVSTVDGEEVTSLVFAEDFQVVDGFATLSGMIGKVPLALYGHVVQNVDDGSGEDLGYLGGLRVGQTKKPGEVELDYSWRSVEKNAVIGMFADANFLGGGTGGEGSKISASVALAKRVTAAGVLFVNTIDPDGADLDYQRLQIQVAARF